MRILLGISIVVLVAILWTTFSIVRHIRVTRRRNRFLGEQNFEEESMILQALPLRNNIAPLPARFAAPIALSAEAEPEPAKPEQEFVAAAAQPTPAEPHIPAGVSPARPVFALQESPSASPLNLIAAARKMSHDLPQPRLRPVANTLPRKEAAELPPLRILEFVPDPAAANVLPAAPVAAPVLPSLPPPMPTGNLRQMRPAVVPVPDSPHLRRPVRSEHPQPDPIGALPAHRSDWIYFNKDMGDLSDPLPGRIRDRVRSR